MTHSNALKAGKHIIAKVFILFVIGIMFTPNASSQSGQHRKTDGSAEGFMNDQEAIILQMVEANPKDISLWESWASILEASGREADAFEVNKMLYLGGAFKDEAGIMKIVQYYNDYGMPFQAAKILEREMNAGLIPETNDALILLSNLLHEARDYARAIPVLESAVQGEATAKLYGQLGEALYKILRCDEAELAFKNAMDLGYQLGKAWLLVATCNYEKSQQQQRLQCSWSEQKKRQSPRALYREKALAAFKKVPKNSSENSKAAHWIRIIGGEGERDQRRCDTGIGHSVLRDECFQDIQKSYANRVFTAGELVLSDPEQCSDYIAKYDELFRKHP